MRKLALGAVVSDTAGAGRVEKVPVSVYVPDCREALSKLYTSEPQACWSLLATLALETLMEAEAEGVEISGSFSFPGLFIRKESGATN